MDYLGIIDARIFYKKKSAQKPWHEYQNCLEAVKNKLQTFCTAIKILGPCNEIRISYDDSVSKLYEALQAELQEQKIESLCYVYADEPFLDTQLCLKMLKNHEKYRADFTFAEGYPSGLTPVIFHKRILDALKKLSENQDWKSSIFLQRNFIFETVKKDINQFYIETEISPVDLRKLRIALNYETKSSALISDRFLNFGADTAEKIISTIKENSDFLWSYPAFYNLQISSDYPQLCTYCPYNSHKKYNTHTFMTPQQLELILDKIIDFSEDAVVSLSYMGEVSLHPTFIQMLETVLQRPSLHLHIETSGIGWTESMWKHFVSLGGKNLTMIITLDSHKPEIYEQIRGKGFDEAMAFTERAIKEYSENTWVQSTRQYKTENELESFYQYFEKKNVKVIIQKYNNFCESLPVEKSVNIAPLERNICWALQREITIQVDGTINICASDLFGKIPIGNAFDENFDAIWQKMNTYRLAHRDQKYPNLCKNCDEYYVFNF